MSKRFVIGGLIAMMLGVGVVGAREETSNASAAGLRREKIKTERLTKLNTRLCEINKKGNKEMQMAVNRLQEVLNKIAEISGKAKVAGSDVSGVETLVSDAQSKLNDAKTKVYALANRACINLSEGATQGDVNANVNLVKGEIENAKKSLRLAKEAVAAAAKALRLINKGVKP